MLRRLLPSAALLFSIVLLVLYLHDSHLESWHRVILTRPRFGSDHIDQGLEAEDKVLVIAKMSDENVDWVSNDLKDWQHAIYHMDNASHILHPPKNVGREAMAYLTFLVDHYTKLPEIMVFLHPHLEGWPKAWHTDAKDYNNVNSVRGLRLDYVREHGYANMRCIDIPGCPADLRPLVNATSDGRPLNAAFKDAWLYFFGGSEDDIPQEVGTPCCSQFAVTRDQVLTRPRADYQRYRQWLLDTEYESETSGRVMEYMWHIMFGKDPVWCPELHQCRCEQFGRCKDE